MDDPEAPPPPYWEKGVPHEVYYPSPTEPRLTDEVDFTPTPEFRSTGYESWTPGGGHAHERAIKKVNKDMNKQRERVDRGEISAKDVRAIHLFVHYREDTPENRERSRQAQKEYEREKGRKQISK